MKKTMIIIGVIILIIVSVIVGIFSMLNKKKTPISADVFNTTMMNKGYVTTDTTDQFEQYGNYMLKSFVAQKKYYQIEFYELSTEQNAINMYNTNKAKFESKKTNTSASTTASINNYDMYSLTTNGKYEYLSRIENTLVYVDVDETYKKEVKDILKEIGY